MFCRHVIVYFGFARIVCSLCCFVCMFFFSLVVSCAQHIPHQRQHNVQSSSSSSITSPCMRLSTFLTCDFVLRINERKRQSRDVTWCVSAHRINNVYNLFGTFFFYVAFLCFLLSSYIWLKY